MQAKGLEPNSKNNIEQYHTYIVGRVKAAYQCTHELVTFRICNHRCYGDQSFDPYSHIQVGYTCNIRPFFSQIRINFEPTCFCQLHPHPNSHVLYQFHFNFSLKKLTQKLPHQASTQGFRGTPCGTRIEWSLSP